MAIYHLSMKIISRSRGKSAVASAAYRACSVLRDERYGLTHDYSKRAGIGFSQILAPAGSPAWALDRQTLWNRVEAAEIRKDAQLAREVEIGIPIEFSPAQSVELVKEYVNQQFVAKGMIADVTIHRGNPANPHARVLLTLRRVNGDAFGPKERGWNGKAALQQARIAWAEHANGHFVRAGLDVRIDHRTLEAQSIELTPARKIGIGAARRGAENLPGHFEQRISEAQRLARENGQLIVEDPSVALHAIAHQRATFTSQDIEKFLQGRTSGPDQFDEAYEAITSSPDLVTLGTDDSNRMRFTTRDMLEAEKSLLNRALAMAGRRGHGIGPASVASWPAGGEQHAALAHLIAEGDIKAIVGAADSGVEAVLAAARRAWEAHGLTVEGAALSGHGAQRLEARTGIAFRTLMNVEDAWRGGGDPLTRDQVLVIGEASMIGTKPLERMLAAADKARAKVVLIGDPEQLRAIEAGAPFRGITERIGLVALEGAGSARPDWECAALQALAAGRTAEGLAHYESRGAVVAADTTEGARAQLLAAWSRDAAGPPSGADSRLMLAFTRAEVSDLNRAARKMRDACGELGRSQAFLTPRGMREFAPNDRVLFLRNDPSLGVLSGSVGTIDTIVDGLLHVRLDGSEERRIAVDVSDYTELEHGYAATVHKSQGTLVDRTYVLASRYFDRNTCRVALSRHRHAATVFYAREEFGATRERFLSSLSRLPPKALAHDYLERDLGGIDVDGGGVISP